MQKLLNKTNFKFSFIFSVLLLAIVLNFCLIRPASATSDPISFKLIFNQSNSHHPTNSLLPCCQNQESGHKIDAPKRLLEDNPLATLAVSEKYTLKNTQSSQYSSYIKNLDFPPPEGKLTGSVYKKE